MAAFVLVRGARIPQAIGDREQFRLLDEASFVAPRAGTQGKMRTSPPAIRIHLIDSRTIGGCDGQETNRFPSGVLRWSVPGYAHQARSGSIQRGSQSPT